MLTTHYTLTRSNALAALQQVEPVFVVMDLAVAWHVDGWIRQGATIRFGISRSAGSATPRRQSCQALRGFQL